LLPVKGSGKGRVWPCDAEVLAQARHAGVGHPQGAVGRCAGGPAGGVEGIEDSAAQRTGDVVVGSA
jgi:hypothetical protein